MSAKFKLWKLTGVPRSFSHAMTPRPPRDRRGPDGGSPDPPLVSDLAKAFGMTADAQRPPERAARADRVVLRDGAQELEVFRESDSVRWRKIQPDATPQDAVSLPSPSEAKARADAKIKELGLHNLRVQFLSVDYTEVIREDPQGGPNGERPQPVEVHVNYRYHLDGVPVVGPGAKIQVTLGPGGEPTRIYRFWRRVEMGPSRGPRAARLKVRSTRDLIERLERDPTFAGLSPRTEIKIRDAVFGYYAAPPSLRQLMLIPVYVCPGTVSVPDLPEHQFVKYIPAVRISRLTWPVIGPAVQRLVVA